MVKGYNSFFKFMHVEQDEKGQPLKEAVEIKDLSRALLLKMYQIIPDGDEKGRAIDHVKDATLGAINSINTDYLENKAFEDSPSVFVLRSITPAKNIKIETKIESEPLSLPMTMEV
jgi:hypothetical protein